nr:putative ribonuclease H-like domain-containing protein [Tanacetum cinerariifolium]
MDADDQAIQTILLGLPEDVHAAVDSCETAKEIWERVRQMMKVCQTKNLHEADFTQIYDFLKMNQEEVNELRAKRLAKSHDPLALMAHSQNSFNIPTTLKDQSSSSTHPQQSFPINNEYNLQPPLNQNFMQPPMTFLEDINDPTKAMNAALILFAKAFQLSAPTNNNQRTSSNPRNRQITQPIMNMVAQNQQGFNAWQNGGIRGAQNVGVQRGGNQNGLVVVPGIANQSGTGNVVGARAEARPRRRDAAYLQTQLLIAQKEEARIQLQDEEFDFMAAAGDLDEIEEEETLELAQESREKMRLLKKEIKPANYAKINHLSRVFVPQTTKSKEELFLSNVSNMVTAFKMISIPNEDLSDDTTPSVARKFINEVKSSLVTLQRVVKQKMTLEVHNWSSFAHKEEADKSLDKQKSLELEIERLLKASVSHDIMSIVQYSFVDVPSDLRTELDRTSVTPHVDKPKLSAVTPLSKKLHVPMPSHSVVQICLWCVDSGCSKHMTGNIKLLINFVWKFLGTIRFGNDHIAAILGYGDLKWGNITITRRNTCFIRDLDGVDLLKDDYSRYTWVHFLRTKDETPEVIKNFLKKISVRIQAPVIIFRTDNETEFKNHVLKEYFDSVGITHETSAAKTPQQNGVVERRNRTLVEAARTMWIFSHAPLFLWAEAIATVCYTQNRSIIHRRFNKTPY